MLAGVYGYGRTEIAQTVRMLLETAEMRLENPAAVWRALRCFEAGGCDLADACLGHSDAQAGCGTTVTFDRGAPGLDESQAI